jgi:hypothetical protein
MQTALIIFIDQKIFNMKQTDWVQELEAQRIFKEKTKLQPDEFYWEQGRLVFTEQYHLRRGRCCNNNCKHCPYKDLSEGDQYRERNFDED